MKLAVPETRQRSYSQENLAPDNENSNDASMLIGNLADGHHAALSQRDCNYSQLSDREMDDDMTSNGPANLDKKDDDDAGSETESDGSIERLEKEAKESVVSKIPLTISLFRSYIIWGQ